MIRDEAASALGHLRTGDRPIEEAVGYSLGHRIRIEIRAALHEGPATAGQLAKALREPLNTVEYHLKGLLANGRVVIARTEPVGNRNLNQRVYAVQELPFFSDEEVAAMSVEDRQVLYAMIVQAASTEALASLYAERMVADPRIMLAWNRVLLDGQGRDELADEELASWRRKEEIAAEAASRCAASGETPKMFVIVSFGFERARTTPPPPLGQDAMPGKN